MGPPRRRGAEDVEEGLPVGPAPQQVLGLGEHQAVQLAHRRHLRGVAHDALLARVRRDEVRDQPQDRATLTIAADDWWVVGRGDSEGPVEERGAISARDLARRDRRNHAPLVEGLHDLLRILP